jgi:hypothetical protein
MVCLRKVICPHRGRATGKNQVDRRFLEIQRAAQRVDSTEKVDGAGDIE